MAVTPADIEKVAKLARIGLSGNEIDPLTQRLNSVLTLIDQLQSIDTDGLEPMANPFDASQRLREDKVTEGNLRDEFQSIAPATEQGLYLVPKVVE